MEERRRILSADAKTIIRSVYGFCKEEKERGMQISLKRALDRAEAMTGVKKRTILDVMSQGDGGKRQPLERVTRVKSYYC